MPSFVIPLSASADTLPAMALGSGQVVAGCLYGPAMGHQAAMPDVGHRATPVADLEHENAELREQLEVLLRPAFSDPQEQLRHEIWLQWLQQIPETDRPSKPLRAYTVGTDFLDSLTVQKVTRARLLVVVVDVLTGDVFGHPARHPHQQQETKSGGKPLVRSDGATAWRCRLKTGTPSAPRLLWWELRDGSIELGRVALHDDLRLR